MSTIRQILESFEGEGRLDDLITALEAREQEKVDALSQVALAHGVMPPVLAKVLVDLDLGAPRTDEEKAFITAQFEDFKAQMIERYSQATGIPAELLQFPATTPPEVDEGDVP